VPGEGAAEVPGEVPGERAGKGRDSIDMGGPVLGKEVLFMPHHFKP
jgi:hypothetical protein